MRVQTGQAAFSSMQRAGAFARFSSLGEGYTVDDLKDAIAGKRRERSAGKSQQVHDKKFSLLIDIQAKLNEGKGAGYQRWGDPL